jgi:hypothetical protein
MVIVVPRLYMPSLLIGLESSSGHGADKSLPEESESGNPDLVLPRDWESGPRGTDCAD